MIATSKPAWVQNTGFVLAILSSVPAINGLLASYGFLSGAVASWTRSPLGLSLLWFAVGSGWAMFLVPKIMRRTDSPANATKS